MRTSIGTIIRNSSERITPHGPGAQFAMLEAEDAAAVLTAAVEVGQFFVVSDEQTRIKMRRRGDDPKPIYAHALGRWRHKRAVDDAARRA